MEKIDQLDRKILRILSDNARVPFKEVAALCKVSRAAVHQRVQRLIDNHIMLGSSFDVNPVYLGYPLLTYVGVHLEHSKCYPHVVEDLKAIPEVVECHTTTGGMDLFIKLYAHNNQHLMQLIHDKLQPLGLQRSETIISFDVIFDRQLPVDKMEVDDDVEDLDGENAE